MSLIYQSKDMVAGRRPGLYLGGKADAKDRDKLEQWRVTHILNVTPAKQANIQAGVPNYFEATGRFVYCRIPIYDAASSASDLLDNHAETIVSFIAKGLLRGSVLVHCNRGISRSSTAALMYLMSAA